MAENEKKGTIYQQLNKMLNLDGTGFQDQTQFAAPTTNSNKIIIKGNSPEEIHRKGLELAQKNELQNKFSRTTDRGFQKSLQYEAARLPAYIDFEGAEYYPIISSALDLFMEEATTIGIDGKMLNIYSNKDRIKFLLEEFFYDTVNVNVNLPFWTRNMPVKYDSMIPLLNGETIMIKEISERLRENPNNEIWTYSIQDKTKKIVPGKIIWCDLTRKDTEILRINLDDNTYIETTPDHEILMRNGTYKKASELIKNDDIMPFDIENNGEEIYNPEINYYEEINDLLSENSNRRIFIDAINTPFSHKITSIEKLDNPYDAYCMEVVGKNNEQDRHNFPICGKDANGNYRKNGVFVSNCKYGDNFVLLYGERKKGITHVKQMVNYEIERFERVQNGKPIVKFKERMTGDEFNTFEIAHFRLLGDDKFLPYGCCLLSDTYVKTNNGTKQIKDIVKNDIVIGFDVKTQKKIQSVVLDTVYSGKKDVLKISTKHNYIDSSKEHKLLIYDSNINDFKYEFVENLKIGDKLIINNFDNYNINKKIDKSEKFTIDRLKREFHYYQNIDSIPDEMTIDFAKFIGFMFGDGWISNNKTVAFALSVYDSQNLQYINLLEKFSGVKPKLIKPAVKTNYEYSQACVGSKMLATILKSIGFNGKAHTKRIPEWVFNSSTEIREAFLDGFIDADGSIFIDEWNCVRYTIELCNPDLIKDLKYLVQSLGYKSGKISNRERINNAYIRGRKINTGKAYYFNFFKSKNKQIKKYDITNRKTNDFIVEPIISIEHIGMGDVYDIHVDNENHNFYANNIVVHNSVLNKVRRVFRMLVMAEDAMLTYRIVRAGEKKVFRIDVGNIDEEDIEEYIYKVATKFKKVSQVTPNDGQIDYRFNILGNDEDYFLPVRNGNTQSGIDTLPGACLTLDTKIELLDGRSLELKDIISEFESGKELWSYSINPETGAIVPGKITWGGITRKNTDVLKITLDNGETITCTPDHKFPTKFSGKKEAKDLIVGESLWSFNNSNKDTYDVISIEFLLDKQDTGTITIDGNEEFHNFHTFALTSGVFTYNSNLSDIHDIEYLRDNLFMGLGIPKPFLSMQDAAGGGKSLAQFDIRFSKKVNRIQQAMIQELNKMAMIHLYLLGYSGEDLNSFTLSLTNPSTQQEQLKAELLREKAQTYSELTRSEGGIAAMSHTTAKRMLFNWSDRQIVEDLKQQKMEKVVMQELADAPVTIKKTGLFSDIDKRFGEPVEGMIGEPSGGTENTPSGGAPALGAENTPPAPIGGAQPQPIDVNAQLPLGGETAPIAEAHGKLSDDEFNQYVENIVYNKGIETSKKKKEKNKKVITENNKINETLNNKAETMISEINQLLIDKTFNTNNNEDINDIDIEGIDLPQ
jgi:intein/homing endonuclease